MANRPVLIVVNGAPGTGKTTLSGKLANDLGLPCLNKDAIKELLFDRLGTGDVAWSQDIGAGVFEMIYAFVDKWVGELGRSLIVESPFFHQLAKPRFKALLDSSDVVFLEIYLKTDHHVRFKRFVDRHENGERHPGHIDHQRQQAVESEQVVAERYAPLRVGETIEVDTTAFEGVDYTKIVSQIHSFIAKQEGKK